MKNIEIEEKDPIETLLQKKFDDVFSESRNNLNRTVIFLQHGFGFAGSFVCLADSITGETIVEMYDSGKLPSKLIGQISEGEAHDQLKEKLTVFFVDTAMAIGIDNFRSLTKDLGINDAENLQVYTFRDPRTIIQKFADAF